MTPAEVRAGIEVVSPEVRQWLGSAIPQVFTAGAATGAAFYAIVAHRKLLAVLIGGAVACAGAFFGGHRHAAVLP